MDVSVSPNWEGYCCRRDAQAWGRNGDGDAVSGGFEISKTLKFGTTFGRGGAGRIGEKERALGFSARGAHERLV